MCLAPLLALKVNQEINWESTFFNSGIRGMFSTDSLNTPQMFSTDSLNTPQMFSTDSLNTPQMFSTDSLNTPQI